MSLVAKARQCLDQARAYSHSIVKSDGHWIGELRSNATITAECVFLRQALGLDMRHDREALCQWLFHDQKPDGSWGVAPGDYSGDVSTSVEAYLALRILGVPKQDKRMLQAQGVILSMGGIAKVRIFTRIFLATFGLFPWDALPSLPVELILVPTWAPVNIYRFSSWARATIIPLLIICHHRPTYCLPVDMGEVQEGFLDDLWRDPVNKSAPYLKPLKGLWGTDWIAFVFKLIDLVLSYFDGLRHFYLRGFARKSCVSWIRDHQEASGDWGGFIPAMHASLLALTLEGYNINDDCIMRGLNAVERFTWQDIHGKRYQASISPVWDTILMAIAFCDSDIDRKGTDETRAIQWIKDRQLLGPEGD